MHPIYKKENHCVGLMLDQRLRRWPSNKPILRQRLNIACGLEYFLVMKTMHKSTRDIQLY